MNCHEAPASMLIPMVILAFGAVFAGYLWADSMGIKFFANTLAPVLGAAQDYSLGGAEHHVNALMFACFGTAAALLGMMIAYAVYGRTRIPRISAKVSSAPEGAKADWTFFFDYIHEIFITMTKVAAFVADMFVDKVLQGIQWTVASIVEIVGDGVSSFQVRKVRVQITLSLLGVAALVAVVLLTGGLF